MSPRPLARREVVRMLAVGIVAVACGRAPSPPAPVALTAGRDECAWCRMLIDDTRLAAEQAWAGGRVEVFGEPGCLLAWLDEHPERGGVSFVVTDDGSWAPAEQARFRIGERRTPMAFDITAHRSGAARVDDFAWADLRRQGAPRVRAS